MSSEPQQLGSSLLSIEANVIIAGLEGIAIGWIPYAIGTSQDILPAIDVGSQRSFTASAVYGVYALLFVVIVGLAVEGLAGALETLARRRWWGKDGRKYWNWYASEADNTKARERTQRWIWKSDQAYRDFARRRLRILVSRNTACCFLILTLVLACIFLTQGGVLAATLVMLVGASFIALFTYLWIDARKGLRNDIANVSEIDP